MPDSVHVCLSGRISVFVSLRGSVRVQSHAEVTYMQACKMQSKCNSKDLNQIYIWCEHGLPSKTASVLLGNTCMKSGDFFRIIVRNIINRKHANNQVHMYVQTQLLTKIERAL